MVARVNQGMQFARYVAVQAVVYGLDLGLFLLAYALVGWGAPVSNVLAKVCAGVFAYLANRHFTFAKARDGGQLRQATLYVALWSLNVPLATGLLALFMYFSAPAVLAKIAADIVCVGLNYWISKNFIFVGDRDRAGQGGVAHPVASCLACGEAMRVEVSWVWRCDACKFMMSTLCPGAGRGVAGLKPLRMRNFEAILDRLEELLPHSSAKLLEVGCAKGWFLERAAERGFQVQGIEPAPDTEDAPHPAHQNIRTGFFPDALGDERGFDALVFNDVFEHLSDPAAAIAEVERRLAPGGLAVFNLPSSDGLIFRLARWLFGIGFTGLYERLWQKGMSSPHITYFNARNLKRFVGRHSGLRRVYVGRLAVVTREGLWERIASTYSRSASLVIFAAAFCGSFVLAWLPSDAALVVFRKEPES